MRLRMLLLAGLVSVAAPGCYGSTEPATEIGEESARLNARGTANNGAAESYFVYQPAGGRGFNRFLGLRRWPAGASGPVSDVAAGLLPATNYSFQFCGYDVSTGSSGGPRDCAQTRTFTTASPSGDRVKASFYTAHPQLSAGRLRYRVDARSGPDGQEPRGSVSLHSYEGFVTCVAVSGARAAVTAVGQEPFEADPEPEHVLVTVALEPAGDERIGVYGPRDTPFVTCANASFGTFPGDDPADHAEAAIHDAP